MKMFTSIIFLLLTCISLASAQVDSIRKVDFRNMDYVLFGGDDEELGTKTAHVRNGIYESREKDSSIYDEFSIGKVHYLKLNGALDEHALVETFITTIGGSPASFTSVRAYYAFAFVGGKPWFVGRLDINEDYEQFKAKSKKNTKYDPCSEWLNVKSIGMQNLSLVIEAEGTGINCNRPGENVTLNYQLGEEDFFYAKPPILKGTSPRKRSLTKAPPRRN